jgi:polysaccharide biosynthesis protein PslH
MAGVAAATGHDGGDGQPDPDEAHAVRVLVVSAWSPYRSTDGDSLVLAHHLHELADRHEIVVLAADDGDGGEPAGGPLPRSVDVRGFAANRLPARSIVSRRLRGLRRHEPDHVAWVERPALLGALEVELREQPPDVVHLFGWGTAQLWARVGGVPCVHMPVDGWTDGLANRSLPSWRRLTALGQRRLVRDHERRHYPHCASVAVVAPGERDRLQRQVPAASVEVVANGVDAGPEPAPRPVAAKPALVFHGSFGTRANQDAARVLVRSVLPLVQRRHPEASVVLIGRDAGPEVRALAGPHVEVTGPVEDVATALQRADVYLAPMVSGSGIKNKVLEAMAAARPVVATPLALDGIGEGAGVVLGANPEELAARTCELLDDRAAAEALGRSGRQRVIANHGWDRSAEALEVLWRAAGSP